MLDYVEDHYPVDETRVYSTRFSNGGAMSVVLASTYPNRFATISAYGWMVDMQNEEDLAKKYNMSFQVIQGTKEYTQTNAQGDPIIMDDEKDAIRSLLLFNEMITQDEQPDYKKVPYWGYQPSSSKKQKMSGT